MSHPLYRTMWLTVATALVAVLASWVLTDAEALQPVQVQSPQKVAAPGR
ncbi:MAG: hypothetical protein WAQ05_17930 [Rubrivivax sp.]